MARLVWLPVGLIDLESALERIVAAKNGVGFIAEWTKETLRGEFEAQVYGGVRTLAWDDARAWILGHLQRGALQLFKVSKADPPVIRTASADFWRSTGHGNVQHQRRILDPRDDPTGNSTYALDETRFIALLDVEFGDSARSPQSEETASGALDKPAFIAPSDSGNAPDTGDAGAPTPRAASRPEPEGTARTRRRGRKKGSGAKDDNASLRVMLDLLGDGTELSVLAAARNFVENHPDQGDNEHSEKSWTARLHRKFTERYGTEPPSGSTWDHVRNSAGV